MTTLNEGNVQQNDDDQIIETFKQSIAPGASEFALAMAKLLYKESSGKNVIFSPINIYSALALVLLGADGGTLDEIIALMGLQRGKNNEETHQVHKILGKVLEAIENTTDFSIYTEEGEKNVKAIIKITNGVFVQENISLVQSYVTQAQLLYKSGISNVNFRENSVKATEIINEFISESTQKRIPRLFEEPLDSATRIVLASCVYFKATWSEQFTESSTKDENFNTGSGNVLVKMMHFTEDILYVDLPQLHLEAVSLYYKGYDVSMIVLLPKPEKTLNDIISSLRVEDLQLITDQSTSANVDLKLPRMKFKWTSDIEDYLTQLGLKQVFSDQSQLTKMVSVPMKISKVTHAAEIEVDENGTEASAATVVQAVCYCSLSMPKPRKQFHVNRPFLFYIHHRNTKSILFFGAVHNPQQSIAPGASEFALSMAKLLYNQSVGKNVVFSPINIYSALALVLLGADGDTFEEIAKLMGLPARGKKDEEVHKILSKVLEAIENTSDILVYTEEEEGERNLKAIINVTNGVFVHENVSLIQSYVTQARSFYKSEISNVDFCNNSAKATDTINEFISKRTQQRIPRLLEKPVDTATRIVLASCVYFKATWNNQFKKNATSEENFDTGSEKVLVKMMQFEKEVPYIDLPNLHLEAVSLDYKGNDVSMIVILPKPEKTINDIVSSLRVEDLQLIADQSTSTNIDLKLPRMKFSWKSNINDYLVQLGLEKAFTDECQLTNMVTGIPVNISRVTHAAEIEVDEDGTEATAATVFEITMRCCIDPDTPIPFHVNRPFIFYIYHRKTNTVLFLGTVHNPQEV
ncbi:uncharacterized protein LOC135845235 [Planococcus citri]|uniref:uncharacterized protein LOC135845235 n=1 Tax=Planococcus citri TaxID=170843 RepID=UPI0031F8B542